MVRAWAGSQVGVFRWLELGPFINLGIPNAKAGLGL